MKKLFLLILISLMFPSWVLAEKWDYFSCNSYVRTPAGNHRLYIDFERDKRGLITQLFDKVEGDDRGLIKRLFYRQERFISRIPEVGLNGTIGRTILNCDLNVRVCPAKEVEPSYLYPQKWAVLHETPSVIILITKFQGTPQKNISGNARSPYTYAYIENGGFNGEFRLSSADLHDKFPTSGFTEWEYGEPKSWPIREGSCWSED